MQLRKAFSFASLAVVCWLVAGCSGLTGTSGPLNPAAASIKGSVHGGQQPVSGATIQLYSVATNRGGGTPLALIFQTILSRADGSFDITGRYTCPSTDALVYITATGGNPGLTPAVNNTAITEMAALGACGNLGASTFIQINEVTTVAAAMALAPYTTPPFNIGSSPSDVNGLAAAFANAAAFADFSTGMSPGSGQSLTPTATTPGVPADTINTLANIIAACVNTPGGVATDTSTPCGLLFSLTGGTADTMSALVNIALSPAAFDSNALFGIITPTAPFLPQLSAPPSDFGVALSIPTGGSPSVFVTSATVSPGDTIAIAQTGLGCLLSGTTSIQFTGGINVPIVGQLCGVVWGSLSSSVPYGIITGTVTTTTNSYPFYVNVVPKTRSGITLSPSNVFWNGRAGTSLYTNDIVLANTTGATINLGTPTITGPSAAYFHIVGQTCGATLAGRAGPCTYTLSFIPPDTGFYYATMVMTATDSSGQNNYTATVNLGGSGQY